MMKTSFKLSTCLALPLLVLSACHGYKDTGVATIRQNNADLKACIQEAAARNPNLKGKMELAFEIDPAGKVNRFAYVLDEYTRSAAGRVCAAQVDRLDFPASAERQDGKVHLHV
jgi:hypothetical protein